MSLVLIGGGGHARVVADVARSAGFSIRGVLTPAGETVADGLTRLGDDDWFERAPEDTGFHIAFGPGPRSSRREALFEQLAKRGARLPPIIASTAVRGTAAAVGEGSIVMHAAVISAGAVVGRNCIVNTRAIVEHDSVVGDHVHIAPGAMLCGGVRIGRNCLVGTGAIILPNLSIADGVVIGAGSVVVRSITDPGSLWYGNPARRKG